MLFGPRAECVRVSDNDRRKRFLVFGGVVDTGNPNNRYVPNLLGSGDSWLAAIEAADQSPASEQLKKDHQGAVDMIRMAHQTASPEEFVDKFTEEQLAVAKCLGASDEEMLELKTILQNAKSKLKPEENKDANHSP